MDYEEARAWLRSLSLHGVQLGTGRVAQALARLGDPQRRFRALHIGGTNGKGSTAAFAAALLLRAARELPPAAAEGRVRIGLYTSPHLLRLTERVRLSGAADPEQLGECAPAQLAAALQEVRTAAASLTLTYFEALTAAAFLLFAQQGVEVAVVEVGLGGRLDATALCNPFCTLITSIGLDHVELLGPTLSDIAREKAGIFRPGVPAYIACRDPLARRVLLGEAARVGAPVADPAPLSPQLAALLPLMGRHQRDNAALALAGVRHAPTKIGQITAHAEVQREGLRAARWPGRLERLLRRPDGAELWVDAAHNPEGAAALADWLRSEQAGRPLLALFGVVAGKQAEDMLAPLRMAQRVVLTRPPSERGRDPRELLPLLGGEHPEVAVEPDVAAALDRALAHTPAGGVLLCYGSIFLVAEVRRLLLNEPADSFAVQDPMRNSLRTVT